MKRADRKASKSFMAQDVPRGTEEPMESAPPVREQLREVMRSSPPQSIPDRGTEGGQTFGDWSKPALSSLRGAMQDAAENPDKIVTRTTQSPVIKLAKAWLAAGTPDDFSIKPEHMEDASPQPGKVERMFPDDDGKWKMAEVNLDDPKPLEPGGVYLVRHASKGAVVDGQQEALKQIAGHTKKLDWYRVRAAARKAMEAGHLGDEEIGQAIDDALPSPDEAASLPAHHLLNVASAASPEKRQSYAPLIARTFGDMNALPEQGRTAIAEHLRQLGFGA